MQFIIILGSLSALEMISGHAVAGIHAAENGIEGGAAAESGLNAGGHTRHDIRDTVVGSIHRTRSIPSKPTPPSMFLSACVNPFRSFMNTASTMVSCATGRSGKVDFSPISVVH